MARYIIDMPTPCACNECPLSDSGVDEDTYYTCGLNGRDCPNVLYGDTKPDWCPLERMSQGGNVATFLIVNSEGGYDEGL